MLANVSIFCIKTCLFLNKCFAPYYSILFRVMIGSFDFFSLKQASFFFQDGLYHFIKNSHKLLFQCWSVTVIQDKVPKRFMTDLFLKRCPFHLILWAYVLTWFDQWVLGLDVLSISFQSIIAKMHDILEYSFCLTDILHDKKWKRSNLCVFW